MTEMFAAHDNNAKTPSPRRRNFALWGVIAVLAIGNLVAVWEIGRTQDRLAEMQSAVETELTKLNHRAHDLTVRADTHEIMLKTDLRKAQELAKAAARRASRQAEAKAKQIAGRVAAEAGAKRLEIAEDVNEVKSATEEIAGQVTLMYQDVGSVKTDLHRTKTELDRTRTELRGIKGDLGIHSGLIATNARELEQLRKLGERDYYEFEVPRTGRFYRVGDIAVALKKTKPKRNKFTIELLIDDKKVEKKDRTINEPVQFYVSGARQPYELVVNEVAKDRIRGYLAVPRILRASR